MVSVEANESLKTNAGPNNVSGPAGVYEYHEDEGSGDKKLVIKARFFACIISAVV